MKKVRVTVKTRYTKNYIQVQSRYVPEFAMNGSTLTAAQPAALEDAQNQTPSLQKIGACAFQNCIALEEIVIPEGIKSLPMGVFAGCRNLRRVVLPESLEYISPYAFYRCDSLESVECANAKRFARALECTPFGQKAGLNKQAVSRFSMELLNTFAGEVPGPVLTAMGYPWFDIDKKYRFFLGSVYSNGGTRQPDADPQNDADRFE